MGNRRGVGRLAASGEVPLTGREPTASEGHFLLAYHDLMTDHRDAAKKHLAKVRELMPNDEIATGLLKQLDAGPVK